ncbi:PREDICTED: F-box protein ETP2-like [Camelina sativa]|uniref:F-box protein ETP2-like n=1 Tax=Camelina sativa TaxID=90675 RepID=A0ABM1R1I6_CAMSA|nr:PREDICTED: F-box protein ETP2-like [Camelina sativa]
MAVTVPELLPTDLVEEILCRVPATSLKRLRSTCKAWNLLIKDDRRFASKHFDNSTKQFMPLLLRNDNNIFPVSINLHGSSSPSVELKTELIDPADSKNSSAARFYVTRIFHCDGLLLCTSEVYEYTVLVWNPLMGETRWIRTGAFRKEGRRNFELGYCYYQDGNNKSWNNKRYKVLSFYSGTKYFDIYDFKSDSWKSLDDDDNMAPGGSTAYSELSVSLKGNAYWFVRDVTKTTRIISLLKFDFTKERSVPVPLPYQSRRFEATSLSVVREEKLSVLLQRDRRSKTEIWVSNVIDEETTSVVSWSKVLALDLSPDLQIWHDVTFLLGEEKKVVVCCETAIDVEVDVDISRDMIYIVGEDNVVTHVKLGVNEIDGCRPTLLNYVPSLVQIEQAGGKQDKR